MCLSEVHHLKLGQIVATCDVMRSKAEKMRDRIGVAYGKRKASGSGSLATGPDIYATHEELVARPDIDVVHHTGKASLAHGQPGWACRAGAFH